jgi:uncharacterized protein
MSEHADMLGVLEQLQKLDASLHTEREKLARAERDLASRESQLDKSKQARQTAEQNLRDGKSAHRDLESELQQLDARIRQLETEAGAAGMQAVEKHKEQVDELENRGLELVEQVEQLEKALQDAGAAVARSEELLAQAQTKLQQQRDQTQATEAEVRAARAPLVESLPEGSRVAYSDALDSHPGSPLALIKDGFCGGCQGELNPQIVVEAGVNLTRCPHCDRLLVPPTKAG